MNFKKLVNPLLSVLALFFGVLPTVADMDVTNETDLSTLLTTGGIGTVQNDFTLSGVINQTVIATLTSAGSGPYTVSDADPLVPQSIKVAASQTLNIYNLTLATELNGGLNSMLVLNAADADAETGLGKITGSFIIQKTGVDDVNFNSTVNAVSMTISGAGDIALKDDTVLTKNYSQSAGTVVVSEGKAIQATTYSNISGGELNLGEGSTLSTSGTTNNIDVSGSAKITGDGTINIGGDFKQSGTSSVTANYILSTGDVNINTTNSTNVTAIGFDGTTVRPVGSYTQTAGTVNTGDLYSNGAVQVNGGGLTVTGNVGSVTDKIGSYTQSGTSVVNVGNINSDGAVQVNGGSLQSGDILGTTYTQTNTSTVTIKDDKKLDLTGDVTINSSTLNLGSGSSLESDTNVTIKGSSAVQGTGAVQQGTINAGGNLQQNDSSSVNVNYILTTGTYTVNTTGTTNATAIGYDGTTVKPIGAYTQTAGNVTTGSLYSSGAVQVNGGSLQSGDILGTTYTQTNTSTVTINDGKKLDLTGNATINSSTLNLGSGSSLESDAGITISGSAAVQGTGDVQRGTINAGGNLQQNGSSSVNVNYILTTGTYTVNTTGTTNATAIGYDGTTVKPIGAYTQTAGNVTTGSLYSSGAVQVNGGSFTATGNVGSATDKIGSYTQTDASSNVSVGGMNSGTNINLQAGSLSSSGNISTVGKYEQSGGNLTLKTGSSLTAGTMLDINGGTVTLDGGSSLIATGVSNVEIGLTGTATTVGGIGGTKAGSVHAGGYYRQYSDSTVNVNHILATQGLQIYGGSLNTHYIGSDGTTISSIGTYEQSAGTVDVSNDLYSTGSVTVSGTGALSVNSNLGTQTNKIGDYTQTTTGTVSVGSLNSSANISLNSGTLTSTGGDVSATGNYSQDGGNLNLTGGSSLSAAYVDINAGTVNLGSNSAINSLGAGNIDIGSPGKIVTVGDAALKTGTINAGGDYKQFENTTVNINNLLAAGKVQISGGILNTNYLGDGTSVGSYEQTGGTVTVLNDLLSTGAVSVSGDAGLAVTGNVGTAVKKIASYYQSTTGTVAAGGVNSTGDIQVANGTFNANGNVLSDTSFIHSGGVVNVATGHKVSGNTYTNIIGGTINLSTGSSLETGAPGNLDIKNNATVQGSADTKKGTIKAGKELNQTDTSSVKVQYILAGGSYTVNTTGKTDADAIGYDGTITPVGSYTQTQGTVNVGDLYSTGAVTVTGGTLKVTGNIGNETNKIASYSQSTPNEVTVGSINSTGNVSVTAGTLISGDISSSNGNYIQNASTVTIQDGKQINVNGYANITGATLNLGNNSSLNTTTSNIEITGASTVQGTGTIKSGADLKQSDSSGVNVNYILADGIYTIDTSGTTNATDIGSNGTTITPVETYIQKNGNVTVNNLYAGAGGVTVDTGKLTVGNGIGNFDNKVGKYIQNGGTVSVGAGGINSTGAVAVNGGTLSTQGNISGQTYVQDGTTVTLDDGKKIDVTGYAHINNGILNFGDGSALISQTDNVELTGSSEVRGTGGVQTGTISAGADLKQLGSSTINVDYIQAPAGIYSIDTTGTTLVKSIGSNGTIVTPVNKYEQKNGNVTASNSIFANTMTVEGGNLTAKTIGTTSNKIGAYTQTTTGTVDIGTGGLNSNNTVTISNGTTNASGDISSITYMQDGGTVNINPEKKIYATGAAEIQSGTVNLYDGSSVETKKDANIHVGSVAGNVANVLQRPGATAYIDSGADYKQYSNTVVDVSYLLAARDAAISGGTLNVNNIGYDGTTYSKVGSYTQKGGNVAVTNGLYAGIKPIDAGATSGSVVIEGGTLTVGNEIGNATDSVGSYMQHLNAETVNVGAGGITSNGNISVFAGTLNAADATLTTSADYIQNGVGTVVNAANIRANSITIGNETPGGSTLNLGVGKASSLLSSDSLITIKKATAVNLNNTTFVTPTTMPPLGASVAIDNSTVNFTGDNNLGSYSSGGAVNSLIYSIGFNEGAVINVGNGTDAASLNLTAGEGNVTVNKTAKVNVKANAVLNMTPKEGNILFASETPLSNDGIVNIQAGDAGKKVILGAFNKVDALSGTLNVNGDVDYKSNVYTNTYNQTQGMANLAEGLGLYAGSSTDAINVSGGTLYLTGSNNTVSAVNGGVNISNLVPTVPTQVFVLGGTNNVITGKSITVNSGAELKAGSGALNGGELILKSGTDGMAFNTGSKLTADTNADIKIQTNAGAAVFNNGSITTVTAGPNTKLSLTSSTGGDITYETGSVFNNAGQLIIDGSNGTATFNTSINAGGEKTGSISKSNNGVVTFNSVVNGESLSITGGTANVNANMILQNNIVLDSADMYINDGVTVNSLAGNFTMGKPTTYADTLLDMGYGSTLSAAGSVTVYGTISAIAANLIAGGDITISKVSTINIKTDPLQPTNPQTTTFTANNGNGKITIGGATVNIEDGAELILNGKVISEDTHYDVVAVGSLSMTSNGSYNKLNYTATPPGKGGAVLWNAGNVNIGDNVTFSGSNTQENGGAIYNEGTIQPLNATTANAVKFTSNRAGYSYDAATTSYTYVKDSSGGAVYNISGATNDATFTLGNNAEFSKNTASLNGGAISNDSTGGGTAVITLGGTAKFTENIAVKNGGAVYNAGNNSVVTVGKNSLFENNRAGYEYLADSTTYIQKNTDSDGGAVYNGSNASIDLNDTVTFNGNVASRNGGAIYNAGRMTLHTDIDGGTDYYSAVFKGNGSEVTNNTTSFNGGAIYNEGVIITKNYSGATPQGDLYGINRVQFDKNKVSHFGGAIYNDSTNDANGFAIQNSTFTGNTADGFDNTAVTSASGGAIYNASGNMTLTNTMFSENSSKGNRPALGAYALGGAVYNAGTLSVDNGTRFYKNTTEGFGGAIYNEVGAELLIAGNAVIGGLSSEYPNGTPSAGNTALKGGGIYNAGSMTQSGTQDNKIYYIGNKATTDGGGLYNQGSINHSAITDDSLNDIVFYKNTAGDAATSQVGRGGALYKANADNLVISAVEFNQNTTEGTNIAGADASAGGAIYNAAGNMTIKGSTFYKNTATGSDATQSLYARGGAIYNETGTLTFDEGTVFSENATDGSGGAIYNNAGTVLVTNSTALQLNTAGKNGGAIYNGSELTLNSGVIVGGITEDGNSLGNKAVLGGGVYNAGNATIDGTAGTVSFISNSALASGSVSGKGGGLYNAGTFTGNALVDTTFDKNTATDSTVLEPGKTEYELGKGGGFYNSEDAVTNITVSGSKFNQNTASIGSAIYNAGTMTIDNSNTFYANKGGSAIGNSGVLTLAPGFKLSDREKDIPNSGVLYVEESGELKLSTSAEGTSLVIDRTGDGTIDGAALHITDHATVTTNDEAKTLADIIFQENIGKKGGALYTDSTEDLTITSTSTNISGISRNVSREGGGGIYKTGTGILTLDKLLIDANLATGNGGGIYNEGKKAGEESTVNINNVTSIKSNLSKGYGGAVYNGKYGIVEFGAGYTLGESSSGYQNIAEKGGGGVANFGQMQLNTDTNTGRSIYFTRQGIAGGTSQTEYGGALYLDDTGSVITDGEQGLKNAVFSVNEAKNGGALYNDSSASGSTILIEKTLFSANNAYNNGGALYNDTNGDMVIKLSKDNVFIGNTAGNTASEYSASGSGGAIYNVGTMTIMGDANYTNVFEGNKAINTTGSGGAIYNAGAGELLVNGNVEFKDNFATLNGGAIRVAGGVVILNLTAGDIKFTNNRTSTNDAASGTAIYLSGGNLHINAASNDNSITFNDADPLTGAPAQTIASEGKVAISVDGGKVNLLSDMSNYRGSFYQRSGIITVKNKFFTVSDPLFGGGGVTGGTLIFDEGALLQNDYLQISNNETGSLNDATIVFKPNTKSQLTDLTGLYDYTATNNYVKYGTAGDDNKITLIQADVQIYEPTANINKNATIGTKEVYAVRDLTLGNGATLSSTINVNGSALSGGRASSLNFDDGGIASSTASVNMTGYNSEINFINDDLKKPVTFNGDITQTGAIATEISSMKINKTGDGTVVFGDGANLSGYTGKYNQSEGTVEFASGSTFLGSKTPGDIQVVGGALRIDDGVHFVPGGNTTITVNGAVAAEDAILSSGIDSVINLNTTTLGMSMVDVDGNIADVEFKNNTHSEFNVSGNSTVNVVDDNIIIGDGNTMIKAIGLGYNAKTGEDKVKLVYTNSKSKTFTLVNGTPTDMSRGAVILGNNIDFKANAVNNETATFDLGDNTKLILSTPTEKVYDDNINITTASSSSPTAYNLTNGSIYKTDSGKTVLSGDHTGFHGSLVMLNGELDVKNGSEFASDVQYNLTLLEDGSYVKVNNVTLADAATGNNDILIVNVPDVSAANGYAIKSETPGTNGDTYNLIVQNDKVNGDIIADGDVLVDNGSSVTFKSARDTMIGNTGDNYVVSVTGTSSVAEFNSARNTVINGALTVDKGTVKVYDNTNVTGAFTFGSTVDMINNKITTLSADSMTVKNGGGDFKVDLNPQQNTSDSINITKAIAAAPAGSTANLNVSDYNVMTDPINSVYTFDIFKYGTVEDKISFSATDSTYSTPVAQYKLFALGGTSKGKYQLRRTSFNPSILTGQVAAQVGGFLSQIETYDVALGNLDMVMSLPRLGYNNKYANANPDDTIVFSPLFIPELEKGLWFRPYGNFEKVSLEDGPDVSNQAYGFLVGGDSALTELKGGFQGTLSAYAGYNGAHQTFDGQTNFQNGGMLGLTGAVYKGGFFSGLTVNANAGIANSSTTLGNEDFFMLQGGLASKTGYNWELAQGKFTIQPSWLMSYTFVAPFDYTGASGVKVKTNVLNAVQLAPGIKLIGNLPHGWQPYLAFNFRFNIGDKTKFKASNVALPESHIKPYVEYGLGVQKHWGDRFTGFGQALFRNGGRNGVGLDFGLRWSLGK